MADADRVAHRPGRPRDGTLARERAAFADASAHAVGLGCRARAAADGEVRQRHRRVGDELRTRLRLPPRPGRWEYTGKVYEEATATSARPPPTTDTAPDVESPARSRGARGPCPDANGGGRQRLRRALMVRSAGPAYLRRSGGPDVADHRVLAAVGHDRPVPRPSLAWPPAAQCADPQGPHLRPHRRPARRPHHVPARNAGGERNWDYRYAWVRDSTFALWGLYTLGLDREANDFFSFIFDSSQSDDGDRHPCR